MSTWKIRNRFGFSLLALLLLHCARTISASGASPHAGGGRAMYAGDRAPVFSDFDGDDKPDQATLSSNGALKNIHLAFGKSSWNSLSFDSNVEDRGRLVSGDIDQDGDIDLVWISQRAGKFVAWLGDGRGNFSVDNDTKFDFDRIQALFGDSGPGFSGHRKGPEPTAVLLSFVVETVFRHGAYLHPRGSPPAIDAPVIGVSHSAGFKPRGPPQQLF